MTTAAHTQALYVALELGQDQWHLAFATQAAEKPRFRAIPARDLDRLVAEIARAKERFRLPADAPVRTCYEAGRDGFWVHRALAARGAEVLGTARDLDKARGATTEARNEAAAGGGSLEVVELGAQRTGN